MLLFQYWQQLFYTNKANLINVPLVKDIFTMIELLKFIGIKISTIKNKNILKIKKY